MSKFDLITNAICIGDPAMGVARYEVALFPGRYTIGPGALTSAKTAPDAAVIDLDGPYLYVFDASKLEQFQQAFHELGSECSYNMMEMENRHADLEAKVGSKVAFFWENDLVGESHEGQYVLDVARIEAVK